MSGEISKLQRLVEIQRQRHRHDRWGSTRQR